MKIRVKSCGDCQFCDSDYDYCDAFVGEQKLELKCQLINSFSNHTPPPPWCPLRTEPIVVELEDCGVTSVSSEEEKA